MKNPLSKLSFSVSPLSGAIAPLLVRAVWSPYFILRMVRGIFVVVVLNCFSSSVTVFDSARQRRDEEAGKGMAFSLTLSTGSGHTF